jgi:hypothetical protein
MIRLTLHSANKHAVRRRGFEVLLSLLHSNKDAVPNAQDPLVVLLAQGINLKPMRSVCRAPNLHESMYIQLLGTTTTTRVVVMHRSPALID